MANYRKRNHNSSASTLVEFPFQKKFCNKEIKESTFLLDGNILDASTEEIPSETPASLTLLETSALTGEQSSETSVSSYKPLTEIQTFVGKPSSDCHSKPGGFSETQHVCT